MEQEQPLKTIRLGNDEYRIVKETRLTPGMVLVSLDGTRYARIGPKQTALDEQIHAVSLRERGFPVPTVLESGMYGDDWYFIENSLGGASFHDQFTSEYTSLHKITDATMDRYLDVMRRYSTAQFDPKNRTTISAEEFVQSAVPDQHVIENYTLLGGDIDRYFLAMHAATDAIHDAPMGVLQYDLNPFNILDGGVIDFELVGYGPIGYDSLLSARWHRWFSSYPSRYPTLYLLDESQIAQSDAIVVDHAARLGLPSPLNYMEEFLLIKSAWGFSEPRSILEEEPSKQQFYRFRATLLQHAVESYLAGKPIAVLDFPSMVPDERLSLSVTRPHPGSN